MFGEYANYDGLGLAELVRTKQVTASELVEAAIERIERLNPSLNAVVYKMYDEARAAGQRGLRAGLFQGVPMLLKDLYATYRGVPTSHGNRVLRHIPMPHDSEMVKRYKAAGLVILGKTNASEFGITPYTEPEAFGPTHNPWDLARTPGGSSGGSAAAVAARMVPFANGSDGGGSIRIPASCCGVFGLKPTRGRTPAGPDNGEAWRGFSAAHALTRSVRDSAALLDATAGADIGAPYVTPPPARPFLQEVTTEPGPLRIAVTLEPFMGHTVDDDCVKGLEETVRLLHELGHHVVQAAPAIDGREFAIAFLTVIIGETRADIEWTEKLAGRKISAVDFEPATYGLGLLGRALRTSDYVDALRYLQNRAREIGRFFESYDVLLTPTVARPPFPIGALQPSASELALIRAVNRLDAGWLLQAAGLLEQLAGRVFDAIPYTAPFNVTGQPAMSVPLYWNREGLPIGMQFVGRFGDEVTLFRLAGQLERARPWLDRVPPLIREEMRSQS